MTMNTYPAQIVFTESDRGGAWKGRLLRPSACLDTQNRHYVVDADELMVLGAAHFCRSGSDVYSLWCQDTGREATDREIAEIDG